MIDVVLVDYGVGNLRSVRRSLQVAGANVLVTGDPRDIEQATRVVLPGVGAFGRCMHELRTRGLADCIADFASSERPMLGICVGMQVLFDASEEFGLHRGLGLLPGVVRRIPATDTEGGKQKIPKIGWDTLVVHDQRAILSGHDPEATVYFVHSFTAEPEESSDRLADTQHGGRLISAAVHRGSLVGTQFHPERSGPTGLNILRRFLSWPGGR